jgi:cytochrome c oxidase assembly factor CtaG
VPARVLEHWQLSAGPLAAALVAAALYVGAAWRTRWPGLRTATFLAGLAALLVALESGADAYADRLLSAHMVQHLLIAMVAAPLLVAGLPLTLALRALDPRPRSRLLRLLRSRLARTLVLPPVAWSLFAAVMLGSHLTPLYSLALRHDTLHALEHALYLGSAVLFWTPVLDANPVPAHRLGAVGRVAYLLLAMPVMAFVGAVLQSSDHVLYADYLAPARALGVSALSDQHDAGALMWVGGKLVMAALLLLSVWLALEREERRQRARERAQGTAA